MIHRFIKVQMKSHEEISEQNIIRNKYLFSLVLFMNFDAGNICEQGYLINLFFNGRESTKTDVLGGFFSKGSVRILLAWLAKESSEFPTLLKLNIFTNFS